MTLDTGEPTPTARQLWRRALPTTFAVHVAQTLLAVGLASWWADALAGAWAQHADGPSALAEGGGLLVETIHALADGAATPALLATIPTTLAWWMLGLPVQLWWIEAMRHPAPAWRSFTRALQRTPAALAMTLVWSATSGALLLVVLAVALAWRSSFASHPDPRWADLGSVLCLLLALGLATTAAAWHDTARAAVVLGDAPLDALGAGWRARRPLVYLGWTSAAGALTMTASLLPGPAWLTLLGGQLLLLGARFLRAAWLAGALHQVLRR